MNLVIAVLGVFVIWYAITSYKRGFADGYDQALDDIEEAERMMQDESDD